MATQYTFPVRAEWVDGRAVDAGVPGKEPLRVAAPPEFDPDADPATWSPEDLLCNALATCVAVTLTGQAAKRRVPLVELAVDAVGTVAGGRFTSFDVDIALVTEPGHEAAGEVVLERATHCLVGSSLAAPVHYTSAVTSGAPAI